jgi:hypothetical protein
MSARARARDELYHLLDARPERAVVLLQAIRDNRIHGSWYVGLFEGVPCGCIYGLLDLAEQRVRLHPDSNELQYVGEGDPLARHRQAVVVDLELNMTPLEVFIGKINPMFPDNMETVTARAVLRHWIETWLTDNFAPDTRELALAGVGA